MNELIAEVGELEGWVAVATAKSVLWVANEGAARTFALGDRLTAEGVVAVLDRLVESGSVRFMHFNDAKPPTFEVAWTAWNDRDDIEDRHVRGEGATLEEALCRARVALGVNYGVV